MTIENTVPKIPNQELAQLRFTAATATLPAEKQAAMAQLLALVGADNMAPLYEQLVDEFKFTADQKLLAQWKAANAAELAKLDAQREDAEKNFGETEVYDALCAKAEYLAKIGDKDAALAQYRVCLDKAVGVGARLDNVFATLRIALFHHATSHDLIQRTITQARTLIDEGGDWDRRNRLKVYEGVYRLSVRDFKAGSKMLLDALATFTSTEVMEFKEFVKYACLAAAVAVPRSEFKVLDAPEILEVIHEIPFLESFLQSLYHCRYAEFFTALAHIEGYLKADRFLHAHYRWYTREMRIIAYAQLLESYRSLSIESMAKSFGVSGEFIDRDLSKFIASGRLNCVIDKVGGIVETNRPDSKNAQYQAVIKQGDLLLNRVQKLGSVINV